MTPFGQRRANPDRPWKPTIDLVTARRAVFALASAPGSDDNAVRQAISELVRLSERPSLERAVHLITNDPTVLERPWRWLLEVMREGARAGDRHLVAAGLFWAAYWTSELVPRGDLAMFLELGLDPIAASLKAEIVAVGVPVVRELDADFMIVGDETGAILAGPLVSHAAKVLTS